MRLILLILFFFVFSFISFAKTGSGEPAQAYFNWITVWLSFFFGLLFNIIFRSLNRLSRTSDQRSNAGLPLSGIIRFLGLNLIARIVIQSYFFWKSDYFLNSSWLHLYATGGPNLQALFIFELFMSLFALTGTGALLYWYVKRRDIFPTMFIYYVGFYIIATFALFIIYRTINLPADMTGIRRNGYFQLGRILYGGAWILYVYKSKQVKQTFVYPY